MAITEELISDFAKVQKTPESQRKEAVTGLCKNIVEGMQGKHFSVLKDVDFDKLVSEAIPSSALDSLRRGVNVTEALDVMASTSFPNLLGTTIQVGMWEAAQQAPMTAMGLIDTVQVGCGQLVTYGYHPLGDIVDDDCMAEKEETPYKGICPPNKLTLPKRCKKKFAMGITREMLCFDVNNQIQQLMRTGGEVAAQHNNKLVLKMMFGLHKKGANPWPHIQDDIPYDTYFKTAGSIWVNQLEENTLDATYTPFAALTDLIEEMRDPFTGLPVVANFPDILVSTLENRQKALMGLGPMSLEYDGNETMTTANEKITLNPNFSWQFGRVLYDPYAIDLIQEWLEDVHGIASDGTSRTEAAGFYLVGNFKEAFAWTVEWPFETLERTGTDTREYFDQEIVYQIKYLWKAAPMVKNPRRVIRCVPTVSGITWV